MVRPEKITEVELLTDLMRDAQGLILADFSGLTVAQANDLRGKCRAGGVEFRVVKNRLARRAAAEVDASALDALLKGPTGIAFGMQGPVEPAKILVDFAKDNEKLQIKGGFLDGAVLSPDQVTALSKVPTRMELLAMIARGFQAPVANFVGVLHGLTSKMVRTFDAVAKQKAEQG
jgi:large subunit ribosomal protein L10